MDQQKIGKIQAALSTFSLVKKGMRIGIGTGSTVFFFIQELIRHPDFNLQLAFSSERSRSLLENYPYTPIRDDKPLDLVVDGADFIDLNGTLIKGGGGALTREKILIYQADAVAIIADESKLITKPQSILLPVEILSFQPQFTIRHIQNLGFEGSIRLKEGSPYITDNKNWIFDIKLDFPFENASKVHKNIKMIPGVVETGLFIGIKSTVYLGSNQTNGSIRIVQF